MVTEETASRTPRRRFLALLGGISTAVIAGVAVVPGVGPLLDPLLRRSKKNSDWTPVGDAKALGKKPVALPVIGEKVDAWTRAENQRLGTVWLSKGNDNEPIAFTAECPHLGCRIGYDDKHDLFVCPCHDSGFQRDGSVSWGPSPRGLDKLEARVVDDKVEVRFKRFQTQVSDKVEIG